MSAIVNSNFNFMQGLSSFWQRLFSDKDVIATLFKGGEQLMGQLYLDLLELVLTPILDRCPLYHKEYWHLVTISNMSVVFNGSKYVYEIPDDLYDFRYLVNRILDPTQMLEVGVDFDLVDVGVAKREIHFYKNIFDVAIYPRAVRKPGIEDGEVLLAFWIPDARFDRRFLYENFGYLVKRFDRSTESYKTFIRGIWNYYTTGPSLRNVESALNLITGLPVAVYEGEVVESVAVVSGEYYVVTDRNEYRWTTEVGIKVAEGDRLDAFQPLTNAFEVADYQSNPEWFDGTVIPEHLMPGAPLEHRVSFKERNSAGIIGEVDLVVDGSWLVGNPSNLPTIGYKVLDRFLATHIFLIAYDASKVFFEVSLSEMREIVLAGKPAKSYAFVTSENFITGDIQATEDSLRVQVVGSITHEEQVSEDTDVLLDMLADLHDYIGDESPNLFTVPDMRIGDVNPYTGAVWRIGEEALFEPTHSVNSGYFYPYIGGTAAGSVSLGTVHDYVVGLEQRGSDNPWMDDTVIPIDAAVTPVIESEDGSLFRIGMTEDGEITTEFRVESSHVGRFVLEAPLGTLYEVLVGDNGVLETQTPPNVGYPVPSRLYGSDGVSYYELSVDDNGYLESRRLW